jgi:N-acetylmuramoyl-L-alanine amidase
MSYTIKEQLANSGNYGGSRNASQIRYLVYHYTGNDGDRAANNAKYFQNNIVKASAHYFVDDTTVWRSVPDLKVAWSVGGSKYANADKTGGGTMYGVITNTNSLSIEMCDTIRNGVYQASEATLANAAALGRALMEKYDIPIENVYRHFDVTGKHCPSYLVNAQKWAEFKKRLEVKIMDNTPSGAHKEGVEWAVANGILTGNSERDLMLSQPVTRQQMCTMLYRMWKLME